MFGRSFFALTFQIIRTASWSDVWAVDIDIVFVELTTAYWQLYTFDANSCSYWCLSRQIIHQEIKIKNIFKQSNLFTDNKNVLNDSLQEHDTSVTKKSLKEKYKKYCIWDYDWTKHRSLSITGLTRCLILLSCMTRRIFKTTTRARSICTLFHSDSNCMRLHWSEICNTSAYTIQVWKLSEKRSWTHMHNVICQ